MVMAMFGFTVNDMFVKLLGETLPVFEIIAKQWPRIFLRAFLEVLATIAFLIALVRISFADVSAVMQSLPLMVTLGAALFLGEAVGWRRWAAIIVGLIGVLIIIRPGYIGFQPATLLVVLAVLFAAARDLITRTLPADVNSYWVNVATALSVGEWQPISLIQYALIFAAAGFLIVGYQGIIRAMRVGEVASVTPFRYTSLLWAIIFGFFVFQEIPDTLTIVGSLIVVSTGLFAWYRERKLAS